MKPGLRILAACLCTAIFIASARPLFADDTGIEGFNALFFRPNVDGTGIAAIDSADVLAPGALHAGAFFQYARRTVSFSDPALGGLTTDLAENQVLADFVLGVGLFEFLDAGLDIPIALMQNGTKCLNAGCTSLTNYTGAGLGDMRFVLKLRLMRDEPGRFGLALASDIGIPTGNKQLFTGGKGPSYEQRLIASKTFGRVQLAANVGYRAVEKTEAMGITYDDALTFGAAARVQLPKRLYAYATINGSTILSDGGGGRTPVEFLGGIGRHWNHGISCDIGGGTRIVDGVSAADVRVMGSCGIDVDLIKRKPAAETAARNTMPPVQWVIPMATNQHRLEPWQGELLDDVIRWLAADRSRRVLIAGNADDRASYDHNMRLSTQRALAARDYLIGHGVPPEQLVLSTRGEALPLKEGKSEEQRGRNRSIVIRELRESSSPEAT